MGPDLNGAYFWFAVNKGLALSSTRVFFDHPWWDFYYFDPKGKNCKIWDFYGNFSKHRDGWLDPITWHCHPFTYLVSIKQVTLNKSWIFDSRFALRPGFWVRSLGDNANRAGTKKGKNLNYALNNCVIKQKHQRLSKQYIKLRNWNMPHQGEKLQTFLIDLRSQVPNRLFNETHPIIYIQINGGLRLNGRLYPCSYNRQAFRNAGNSPAWFQG